MNNPRDEKDIGDQIVRFMLVVLGHELKAAYRRRKGPICQVCLAYDPDEIKAGPIPLLLCKKCQENFKKKNESEPDDLPASEEP